jgi:hypothetical protein
MASRRNHIENGCPKTRQNILGIEHPSDWKPFGTVIHPMDV